MMKIRAAAASTLAALAWAGALFAQAGGERTLTGQVVSTGNTSIVVRTDDGRGPLPLIITTTTHLPPGLAAGNRVTVYYHDVGDRHVADRVVAAASAEPPPAQDRPASAGPSGRGGPSAEPG